MKSNKFYTFFLFWATQSVSQMGSAMSGYALTIWAYSQTHTAMSVSLFTFCYYVSYVMVSLFSGSVIDRHGKKGIMLLSDSIAALCTLFAFVLWRSSELQLWHIYVINAVIGMMNAFQAPAESVTIGLLVSADKQAKASGMDSFAGNLVTVVSPVLAVAVYGTVGLGVVFLVDFVSFLFTCDSHSRLAKKCDLVLAGVSHEIRRDLSGSPVSLVSIIDVIYTCLEIRLMNSSENNQRNV